MASVGKNGWNESFPSAAGENTKREFCEIFESFGHSEPFSRFLDSKRRGYVQVGQILLVYSRVPDPFNLH